MQGQIGVSHVTFLIVDDVPTIRLILRRAVVLGAPNSVVHAAGTVAEARDILANNPINVVLTDYHLPDGNGFQVVNAARAIDQTIQVILMSADATIAEAALRLGAYAFLAKPFDMPLLLQLLGDVSLAAV